MLSERRSKQPFGLQGGGPGASGLNLIVRRDGCRVNMGGKATALLQVAGCCFWCSMLASSTADGLVDVHEGSPGENANHVKGGAKATPHD